MDEEKFCFVLDIQLFEDIDVILIEFVVDDFYCCYVKYSKIYEFIVDRGCFKNFMCCYYVIYFFYLFDVEWMQEVVKKLEGIYDFIGFIVFGISVEDKVCIIIEVSFRVDEIG